MKNSLILFIYFMFIYLLYSCSSKNQDEVNKVLLCGLDKLLTDYEFRYFLIGGENYIAWVPDGCLNEDSLTIDREKFAFKDLKTLDVGKSFVNELNIRFPEGHKLKLVSQKENEHILRNKQITKSCWYFGCLKKHKKKYFLKGGFAVSPKAGIGADFIIEIINNECKIIEYNSAIL